MQRDVVITGLGPVTSIGAGASAMWDGLAHRRPHVTPVSLPVDVGTAIELPIAAMPDIGEVPGYQRYDAFLREQDCAGGRDLGFAMLAAELALQDAGVACDRNDNAIGMIQVFEAPGVERTVRKMFAMLQQPPSEAGPPGVYQALAPAFYHMQSFMYVHLLSKAFGFHGPCTSVHNACSSGAVAIDVAAMTIASGKADVMIVVGGEAFDTAVRLEWFRALDLYATGGEMRPFDEQSTGFYVGEGAGAVVLESRHHAEQRGATPYAEYLGGRSAHQAWKQTVPDIRAARLSSVIGDVLHAADVAPSSLDLIVLHGAATSLSDRYEAKCLEDSLGATLEHTTGIGFKPHVGHLLATSGIMDTIGGLLCMRHQATPGFLREPVEPIRTPMTLPCCYTPQAIDTMMTVSTGFTGHDTAAIYRRL